MNQSSGRALRFSDNELRDMLAKGQDRTDWARLDAQAEDAAEAASIEADEGHIDWLHATPDLPRTKQPVSIRLDIDVLQWFRGQGAGYQTRINQILRRYVEAQQRKS